jgi:hypothetical protein
LKNAGRYEEVRWQVSQDAVVTTWPAGLPVAWFPLWHVAQLPGCTPTWLKRAPANVAVVWQALQGWVTGMWFLGITTAETRLPIVWQEAHCVGVPLKTPLWWQESQRAA